MCTAQTAVSYVCGMSVSFSLYLIRQYNLSSSFVNVHNINCTVCFVSLVKSSGKEHNLISLDVHSTAEQLLISLSDILYVYETGEWCNCADERDKLTLEFTTYWSIIL